MKARISLGIIGALVALTVSLVAFAGAPGAGANTGDPVKAGDLTTADNLTYVRNTDVTCPAMAFGKGGFAACGDFAVVADGTIVGVHAFGDNYGIDAYGEAAGSTGVYGEGKLRGLHGKGVTGVYGEGSFNGVYGKGGNGVYGEGTENGIQAQGGTFGVFAEGSDYGTYSRGPNYGVFGSATGASGTGVWGESSTGTGVRAMSASGVALQVTGKARFSRSGVVTVNAGASSKTVTLGRVSPSSMVIATAQQSAGVYVKAAVPGSGSFTIKLTGNAPAGGLRVAYFVLN